MCNSKEDVKFDSSSSNNTLNLTLMVENLQVQPHFEYVEDKGDFDSGKLYSKVLFLIKGHHFFLSFL